MAHACSFRGYCYGHIPFVSTECPHVPCMFATGHPESHYLKSGPGAGGPFTTDPAAQSSLAQVRHNCNCCWVFFIPSLSLSTLFFFEKKQNNFDALLTFFFYQFQVFLQEMCLGIEMCNHTLQKWVLAYFIWEVLSEEAILLEIRQEWIPVNNCVHFQQRKWHFNTHKKRNL